MFLPPFLCSLPHTVPVPALRPCLTCTAFTLTLARSTALPRRPGGTSPACIISGDGYSVVEVQCGDHPLTNPSASVRLFENEIDSLFGLILT